MEANDHECYEIIVRKKAMQLWIESARADGQPVPASKRPRLIYG